MSQRKDTGLNTNPWPKLVDHYNEDVINYFKNPDRREYGTMRDLYQFVDRLPE
jgi:hypothetical protein